MPRVKPGPWKWAIYYTHVPIWVGMGKDRRMVLDPLIYGWWGYDAWVDWEYRAIYDTKEEAEKDAAEFVKEDPERWEGVIHVAPTLKLTGEEFLVTKHKEDVARADREAEEWGRKHDAEVARLEASLKAQGWTVKGKA